MNDKLKKIMTGLTFEEEYVYSKLMYLTTLARNTKKHNEHMGSSFDLATSLTLPISTVCDALDFLFNENKVAFSYSDGWYLMAGGKEDIKEIVDNIPSQETINQKVYRLFCDSHRKYLTPLEIAVALDVVIGDVDLALSTLRSEKNILLLEEGWCLSVFCSEKKR